MGQLLDGAIIGALSQATDTFERVAAALERLALAAEHLAVEAARDNDRASDVSRSLEGARDDDQR
jgi:hypothetical protein